MQYRAKSSMDADLDKIKRAHDMLVDADKALSELVSSIRGDQFNWEGKNKEAALSLLALCSQYSNKLLPISEKNYNSMNTFNGKANDFMSNSSVIQPWR
jgi:hypothetical protein